MFGFYNMGITTFYKVSRFQVLLSAQVLFEPLSPWLAFLRPPSLASGRSTGGFPLDRERCLLAPGTATLCNIIVLWCSLSLYAFCGRRSSHIAAISWGVLGLSQIIYITSTVFRFRAAIENSPTFWFLTCKICLIVYLQCGESSQLCFIPAHQCAGDFPNVFWHGWLAGRFSCWGA